MATPMNGNTLVSVNAIPRKRAQQEQREAEQWLSMAASAANIGLWVLSANGESFRINSRVEELFGLPPGDELAFDRFISLVHPEDREIVRSSIVHVVDSQGMLSVRFRVVRPDGAVRWMDSRGSVRAGTNGEPARLMGTTADITEHKEFERQLHQALEEFQQFHDRLQMEKVQLSEHRRRDDRHETIAGQSEPVLRMLAMVKQVAPTDSAVLIAGETGTGKELLAHAIHNASHRSAKAMVTVNCAALPAPLIESELFGRERGAYTGAMTQQIGRFELADGSTVFLDEIGDFPLEIQMKLLRVLNDGQYERLGSTRTRKTNARVIAATNRDLGGLVREGKFREDLFHRLNVFPIEVPPLRARVDDIPLLVWRFVQEFNEKMGKSIDSIPKRVMDQIMQYPWPGNIRELRNFIERAVIVSDGRSLIFEFPAGDSDSASPPATLDEIDRKHIRGVLERVRWRISGKQGAAEILGLRPTTLHSRMKKLGISRPKS